MPDARPFSVSAIVLAYGAEPWLRECIRALLASAHVDVEVLLVDNGCTSIDLTVLSSLERVRMLRPSKNLGYSLGCNLAASRAAGEVFVFVNSDCIVTPLALATLARAVCEQEGLVTASVRLGSQPDLLNSSGNPVHFLGFSWAGCHGEPAPKTGAIREVTSVSGACFGVSREVWMQLGGFAEGYFAYHEDVELSLRCWLSGRTVRYVPEAIVHHHYEFARNPEKMYLLERNRLITWLSLLELRTLVLLAPMMLFAEVGVSLVAARQGWLRHKARGWLWLMGNAGWIRARRREMLRQRVVSDRVLSRHLSGTLNPGGTAMPPAAALANAPLAAYWWIIRRLLRATPPAQVGEIRGGSAPPAGG